MASNMIQATVEIQGTKPLLWHAFTPDSIPADGKKEKTGVAGNDPQEWRRSFLADHEGRLFVNPEYIFGCLRDGARHTKKGRGSIMSNVAATLQIVDERIYTDRYFPRNGATGPFDPASADRPPIEITEPVYLDVRSVKNPSTKGRNVRYRVAASPGWRASFTILWDKTIVSRTEMEAVITDAGRLVGLGDGRSIGFGRFMVVPGSITFTEV